MKKNTSLTIIGLFILLPTLLFFLGNNIERAFWKEAISLLTIIAFMTMILQFFLSRASKDIVDDFKLKKTVKWHKVLGYVFVSVLIVHPFLIILPRYFDAGTLPSDAFKQILLEFNSIGISTGLVAWLIMVTIGMTSLFRKQLPLKYTSWRLIHGVLSIIFLCVATIHVIYLGRHVNIYLNWLILFSVIVSISIVIKKILTTKNV